MTDENGLRDSTSSHRSPNLMYLRAPFSAARVWWNSRPKGSGSGDTGSVQPSPRYSSVSAIPLASSSETPSIPGRHSPSSSLQNMTISCLPFLRPDLPILCTRLEQEYGAPICTTRSSPPMSTPSSRVTVATTVAGNPPLRSSSAVLLMLPDREPWWTLTGLRDPFASDTLARDLAVLSAPALLLVNTMHA